MASALDPARWAPFGATDVRGRADGARFGPTGRSGYGADRGAARESPAGRRGQGRRRPRQAGHHGLRPGRAHVVAAVLRRRHQDRRAGPHRAGPATSPSPSPSPVPPWAQSISALATTSFHGTAAAAAARRWCPRLRSRPSCHSTTSTARRRARSLSSRRPTVSWRRHAAADCRAPLTSRGGAKRVCHGTVQSVAQSGAA